MLKLFFECEGHRFYYLMLTIVGIAKHVPLPNFPSLHSEERKICYSDQYPGGTTAAAAAAAAAAAYSARYAKTLAMSAQISNNSTLSLYFAPVLLECLKLDIFIFAEYRFTYNGHARSVNGTQ